MQYVIAFFIPVFSYFLQTYPRFFNRYFGVDVWTRLIEIDHVRKSIHKIPGQIKNGFIINGYFDYPIIFPWILSFLPKKTLFEIQGFISPIFDCLQNVLVYYIAFSLLGSIQGALLAQIIYTFTPVTVIENSYLTPRSLGYLLFTLSLYPLITYHLSHQWGYLIVAYIATTILFITHRFALQSLIFISLFFTIFDRSIIFLLNFILAFASIMLITKGYYLHVLRGHLYNIYFWTKNYQYRFAHQVFRNNNIKKQDWVGAAYSLLSNLSPIFIFTTSFWTISAFIYLYLLLSKQIHYNPFFFQMAIWVIFFYLLSVVVLKVKHLTPIGEGQRYLEMAIVPSSILSAFIFLNFYSKFHMQSLLIFILLILGNFLLILLIQVKGILKDKNRSLTIDMQKAFNYINSLNHPRIMCIPHQITTMTVYNTKAEVLVNADNKGLLFMSDFFPVLKKSIKYTSKKYKINYLLIRESYVNLKELKIKQENVVFRSGDVTLVKLH